MGMKMANSWIIYSCLIFGSGILCDRKLEKSPACSDKLCIDWSLDCDNYENCSDGSDNTRDMSARYEFGTDMTMVCGRLPIKNQVISEKGNDEAMVSPIPWYVGIYKLKNSDYEWTCGGSIIAPNIVISAARCFWTKGMVSTNITINYSLYKIDVRGYDRHLTNNTNAFTQRMNVQIIYLAEDYNGRSGVFNKDIAVIVLENKMSFKNGLAAPVCIDWRNEYNVVNGDEGKIVVKNITNSSKERHFLLEQNASYINSTTCPNFETVDKFCAGHQLEKGIEINGIEGTGISFLHNNSYFLTGLNTRMLFMKNGIVITIYTDIKYNIQWICGILNKHMEITTSTKKPSTKSNSYSALEMCSKYSELITYRTNSPILTTSECNYNAITNGTAAPKEFPHMALLGYDEQPNRFSWFCGGSLISNRFVLTAAHCEKIEMTYPIYAKWARLGELDYNSEDDDARPTDYKIIERIIHPNYKSPSLYNDIALFKLERDVHFSAHVRPICLNTDNILRPPAVMATGWGREAGDKGASSKLLKVRLSTISTEECDNSFIEMTIRHKKLGKGILENSMLCADNSEVRNTICSGYGGGPIQIKHNSCKCMYSQIGIISFGNFCGQKGSTVVFTRVSNYISWIESIVWQEM